MALKGLQRWWYRLLGPWIRSRLKAPDEYEQTLQKTNVAMRPEAYLANAIANAGLAFVVTLLLVVFLDLVLVPALAPAIPVLGRLAPLLWLLPFLLAFLFYYLAVGDLGSKAKKRQKEINLKLP